MMNKTHHFCLLFCCLALTAPLAQAQAAESAPLFEETDILDITLSGTFRTIDRSRDKEREYERGLMSWVENDQENSLEV